MSRVKKGVHALKRRRKVLAAASGYRFGRSKKEKQAKEAILHAGKYAFAHRRKKKGDFRRLWQTKIGAAAKLNGTSYSKFIGALAKQNIELDRKILAMLAEHHPEIFEKIAQTAR